MNGTFAPGEKLLLKSLAERLGTSITPVREALLQLVSEQALIILSDRSVAVPTLDRERLMEIRNLRVDLEGTAIEAAVPRMKDEDVLVAEQYWRRLEQAKAARAGEAAVAARQAFHFHLYELGAQPALTKIIEGLWVQAGPLIHAELNSPSQLLDVEHSELIAGLRRRDAVLCRVALQRLILQAFERTREHTAE